MPSAIVATIGSASANSYVTEDQADTYFDDRLNASAWNDDVDDDDKARALFQAARRLDRENWIGSRVTATQALAWPRAGAAKPDNVGGTPWPEYGTYLPYYETTEIPQLVKDAQCELALSYLNGYGSSSTGSSTVKSFSDDKMSVSFGEVRSDVELPEEAMRLISALVRGPQLARA